MVAIATSWVFFCFFEEKNGGLAKHSAVAAATGHFGLAVRVFAHELAFRLGTLRFGAFPVTSRLFANRLAFRLGGLKHKYFVYFM